MIVSAPMQDAAQFAALLSFATRAAALLREVQPAVFCAATLREPKVAELLREFDTMAPAWRVAR